MRSVPELLVQNSLCHGDKAAFADDRRELSWAELERRTARLAARLTVGRGARVAFCLDNTVEVVEGLLATVRAAAVGVPLSSRATDAELTALLADGDPAALVTDRRNLPRIARLTAGRALLLVVTGEGPAPDGVTRFEDLVAEASAPPPCRTPTPTRCAYWVQPWPARARGSPRYRSRANWSGWSRSTHRPSSAASPSPIASCSMRVWVRASYALPWGTRRARGPAGPARPRRRHFSGVHPGPPLAAPPRTDRSGRAVRRRARRVPAGASRIRHAPGRPGQRGHPGADARRDRACSAHEPGTGHRRLLRGRRDRARRGPSSRPRGTPSRRRDPDRLPCRSAAPRRPSRGWP